MDVSLVTDALGGLSIATAPTDADPMALADAMNGAVSAPFALTIATDDTGAVYASAPEVATLRQALAGVSDATTWTGPDDQIMLGAPSDVTEAQVSAATIADDSGATLADVTFGPSDTGPVDAQPPADGTPAASPAGGGPVGAMPMATDNYPKAPDVTGASSSWEGCLIVEGIPSGDGRHIDAGALSWRELPLPLMLMTENPVGATSPHDGAQLVGRIDWVERRGAEIWGGGILDLGAPHGMEAQRLISEGFLRGVSVDLDSVVVGYENSLPPDAGLDDMLSFDPGDMHVEQGRLMGATLCPFPAFQEASVHLVDQSDEAIAASAMHVAAVAYTSFEGGLVASGPRPPVYPTEPPMAWFQRREFDGPTPVRVTPDGQIYGHVAAWGSCHIGFDDRCVPVPRSSTNYSAFRVGQVLTAEGVMVSTGPIIMDTVHPDLRLQASDAQAFYAHTGCGVGDVAVYEDRWGIQIAGAVRPAATPDQVRALRASDISPDWRRVNGKPLECVAMLVVSNSGFKTPQALAASAAAVEAAGERPTVPGSFNYRVQVDDGEVLALVAAGMVHKAAADFEVRSEITKLWAAIEGLQATVRPIRAGAARQAFRPVNS